MWLVYILECADKSFYTGITTNLENRLQTHKEGKGAKYMKGRSPFTLIYTEEYNNRSEASKREIEIKSLTKRQKLTLIKRNNCASQ